MCLSSNTIAPRTTVDVHAFHVSLAFKIRAHPPSFSTLFKLSKPDKPNRCCVLHSVVDEALHQVARLRSVQATMHKSRRDSDSIDCHRLQYRGARAALVFCYYKAVTAAKQTYLVRSPFEWVSRAHHPVRPTDKRTRGRLLKRAVVMVPTRSSSTCVASAQSSSRVRA